MGMQLYTAIVSSIIFASSGFCGAQPTAYSARIKVALLDTGLNLNDPRFADVLCPSGHVDFTGEGIYDYDGHGTHVAGILSKTAYDHTKYCIVVVKVLGTKNAMKSIFKGLAYVKANQFPLVNYSISGDYPSDFEKDLMNSPTTTYSVAAGNNGDYYGNHYPAGYKLKNVKVVGNWDCHKNKVGPYSNYGAEVIWRCGTNILSYLPLGREGYKSGTSMAAPVYTGELINQMTKEK